MCIHIYLSAFVILIRIPFCLNQNSRLPFRKLCEIFKNLHFLGKLNGNRNFSPPIHFEICSGYTPIPILQSIALPLIY